MWWFLVLYVDDPVELWLSVFPGERQRGHGTWEELKTVSQSFSIQRLVQHLAGDSACQHTARGASQGEERRDTSALQPHRASLLSSPMSVFFPGFGPRQHPGAQHVPAAGQRAGTPEALQQEGPPHGLDQEERALQQPIERLTSYTCRFFKSDFWQLNVLFCFFIATIAIL